MIPVVGVDVVTFPPTTFIETAATEVVDHVNRLGRGVVMRLNSFALHVDPRMMGTTIIKRYYDYMAETEAADKEAACFMSAAREALQLAPDTRQHWGVAAQRKKCLEEMDELIEVLMLEGDPAYSTVEYERLLIDECADAFIMAISGASTIGAANWVEQLAARIVFKTARTRDRMRSE